MSDDKAKALLAQLEDAMLHGTGITHHAADGTVTRIPPEDFYVDKLKAEIAIEIYRVMERLGARSDLLGIVGSWCDTQSDEWTLKALRRYNEFD